MRHIRTRPRHKRTMKSVERAAKFVCAVVDWWNSAACHRLAEIHLYKCDSKLRLIHDTSETLLTASV